MDGRTRIIPRPVAFTVAGLVAIALNVWLDRTPPNEYSFEIFYVIPILAVTVGGGRYAGALIALVAAVAWTFDTMQEESYALASMGWDAASRAAIFIGLAILVDLYNKRGTRLAEID